MGANELCTWLYPLHGRPLDRPRQGANDPPFHAGGDAGVDRAASDKPSQVGDQSIQSRHVGRGRTGATGEGGRVLAPSRPQAKKEGWWCVCEIIIFSEIYRSIWKTFLFGFTSGGYSLKANNFYLGPIHVRGRDPRTKNSMFIIAKQ